MLELWISLDDIPAEGREFHFTDQALWLGPMRRFGVDTKVSKDFEARMYIVPQDDGFLVNGSFSGAVVLPCDRCTEDVELPVEGEFDSFESPEKPGAQDGPEGEGWTRLERGKPELDVAGYLWEQFLLALPQSALCSNDCKGLCPGCGQNRNQGTCACAPDEGDPRLAVLRNLKLS